MCIVPGAEEVRAGCQFHAGVLHFREDAPWLDELLAAAVTWALASAVGIWALAFRGTKRQLRLKVIRQADAIRAEPPPLPGNGPYRVMVADPPWPHEACAIAVT
jgi:hypothetical protein